MNATESFRRSVRATHFMTMAWLACSAPDCALAYGVYEEEIITRLGQLGIVRPASVDAPEFYRRAFLTPAPFDNDRGLQAVEGYLDPDEGDFADMYCLFIGEAASPVPFPDPFEGTPGPRMRYTPQEFSVRTVPPERTIEVNGQQVPRPMMPDPQLFLFDAMGRPVVGNDDVDDTNQQSSIPLGTITQPGVYILAVTGSGYDPVDAAMNALFTNNSTDLKTPTNAAAVQARWSGTHNQDAWYRLEFGVQDKQEPKNSRFGAEHWIPEPGALALLVLGFGSLMTWHRMR